MKKLLPAIFIAFVSIGFAQEVDQQEETQGTVDSIAPSIKRFSVGFKIGVPNIA